MDDLIVSLDEELRKLPGPNEPMSHVDFRRAIYCYRCAELYKDKSRSEQALAVCHRFPPPKRP